MPQTEHLHPIELIPVLELEPGKYAKTKRDSPDAAGAEAPAQWQQYWRDSLADSELVGLNPIEGWFVATSQLNVEQLAIILRATTETGEISELEDDDAFMALTGGFALTMNGEAVITPQCCIDLASIHEWDEAISLQTTEWETLWIGHPWVAVRYDKPLLCISDYHESNEPSARWTVDPSELSEACEAARHELHRLAERIAMALRSLRFEGDIGSTAKKLAGLAE